MTYTPKKGDLLFCYGNSWIDDAIQNITHGAAHVAVFVDENTLCEAQYGREIGEISLDYYMNNPDVTRLVVYSDQSLTDAERDDMMAYAKTLYGEHYDIELIPLELLHYVFKMNIEWYHEGNIKICSSFAWQLGKHEGKTWSHFLNPAPADLERDKLGLEEMCVLKGA